MKIVDERATQKKTNNSIKKAVKDKEEQGGTQDRVNK